MPQAKKARAVGFNHVALEVGDIDEALAFYGRLFDFTLRGREDGMAFTISAISSWRCRAGARSRATTDAISASWSTTRRRCARRSSKRA